MQSCYQKFMVAMILERNLDIPANYKLPFEKVKRKILPDKIEYLTVDDYVATEVVKRYLSEHKNLLLHSQIIMHGLLGSGPLRDFLINYGHLIRYSSLWETQLLTVMPWLKFPKRYTCKHFLHKPDIWGDVFQTSSELGYYPYKNFLNDGMMSVLSQYDDCNLLNTPDYVTYQNYIIKTLRDIGGMGADLWFDQVGTIQFKSYGRSSMRMNHIDTYYRAGGVDFKGNLSRPGDAKMYLSTIWNEVDLKTFPSYIHLLTDVITDMDTEFERMLKSNGNNIKLFHVVQHPSPISLDQLLITNYDALALYFGYGGTVPMAILEQKIADFDVDTLPENFSWTNTLVYRWICKAYSKSHFEERCYYMMTRYHSFAMLLIDQVTDFNMSIRTALLRVVSKLCMNISKHNSDRISLIRLITSLYSTFSTRYVIRNAPDALHFVGNQFVMIRELLIDGLIEPEDVPIQYLNMCIIMEEIWKKGFVKFRYFTKPSQRGTDTPTSIALDQIFPTVGQLYTVVVDWDHPGYVADVDPAQLNLINYLVHGWISHSEK